MKRILITAICFISLINGADDTKEINFELSINGHNTMYRGYILSENESKIYSFIGIHQDIDFTSLVAQKRGPFDPVRNGGEHFVRCFFDNKGGSAYEDSQGLYFNRTSFNKGNREYDAAYKAVTLFQLYVSTHAKRTVQSKSLFIVIKDY